MAKRRKELTLSELNKLEKEILERARAKGIEDSYLFATTFTRYQEHLEHLKMLQNAIDENGTVVEKEYVKGRCNIYVNPAIPAYNSTAQAADKAAALLFKFIAPTVSESSAGGDEFDNF